MDHDIFVSEMFLGQELEGYYILTDASVRSSSNGKPFLSGKLTDSTGSIEMKVWDFNTALPAEANGSVVKVRGEVTEFKSALQFNVRRFRLADPEQDSYDLTRLVPTAPIDTDSALEDIKKIIAGIEDSDYRIICEIMLERHKESFVSIPAAKSIHHSFRSGLLMHTGDMLRLAEYLADQYCEVIDRSLLLAGTFLHDFAKDREFTLSPLGLAVDYSPAGKLLGHLVMGAQEVCDIAREKGIPENKSMLLQHMLLSHHGDPEFGAAVIPQCAEAELLSFIDRIDSRMEIYAETFNEVPVGQFSNMIFALNKRLYHHE